MIVYVEWVLFDNFCLDALLGYLTLRCVRAKVEVFKVVLSAAVGSLFALLSPMVRSWTIVFKLGVLLTNTALLHLKISLRAYLIRTLVYAVLSFTLSGILTFLLGGKWNYTFVGVAKGGIVGIISLSVLLLTYFVRQINGLMREKKLSSKCVVAELICGDRSVRLNALYDSGNLLTDRNGEGVVVSDEASLRELGELEPFGEMSISSAGGSKVLKLVKIPCIKIYSEGRENTLNNVTVALSDLPEEYAVILPT